MRVLVTGATGFLGSHIAGLALYAYTFVSRVVA